MHKFTVFSFHFTRIRLSEKNLYNDILQSPLKRMTFRTTIHKGSCIQKNITDVWRQKVTPISESNRRQIENSKLKL